MSLSWMTLLPVREFRKCARRYLLSAVLRGDI
jgi:hypothetical protein